MSEATYVPILPDLSTFFKETSKGAKSAGEQAGRDFAGGMEREVKRAEKAVETAARAQERAANRAADATAKRRLEEQKLAEVMEKGNAKQSDILAATNRLEKARRDEASSIKNAEKASADLASKQSELAKTTDEASNALEVASDKGEGFNISMKDAALGVAAFTAAAGGVVAGLVSIGTTFDDAYDTIRIGTGAAGDDFEGLKESMKAVATESIGVGSDMGEIGTVLADINTRLGLTGEPLEKMTAQFLQLQQMGIDADINDVSGALTQFGVSAEDAPGSLDMLFQISQATGRSITELTGNLSKSGPALQEFGFGLEESAGLLGALDKAGLDSEKTLGSMTRALSDFAKDGKDPQEALWGTIASIDELTAAGKNAEAIDLANSIFGARGGAGFVAAVESGQFAYDDFLDSIGATSDTISGVAEETADFAEHWDRFKLNALVAIEPVATAVFNSLTPALEKALDVFLGLVSWVVDDFVPAMQAAGEWIQKNESWLKPLAVTVGVLTAGYVGLAAQQSIMAAGGFLKWMGSLSAITKVQTAAQAALNVVMAANPIALVAIAIAGLTAGLVYFFTQTEFGRELWGKFTTALSDGWNIAVGALSAGWEWLKTTVFDAWTNTVAAVQAHWNLATNALAFAWAWVKDQFVTTWSAVKTGVFDAWNTVVGGVKATWDTVTGALSTAWTWFKDQLHAGYTWIKSNVFSAFEGTMNSFKGFFETIVDGITSTWNKLRGALARPINFMIGTVYNEGILKAWNIIADILPGLKKGSPLAGIPEHATGGRIVGPGTGTSDDVLMWGSNGEHMMTALEVKRLGGHDHVYAMREAIRTGHPFVSDGRGGITVLPQKTDNRAGDLAGAAPDLMLPAFKDGGEIQPLWKQQLAAAHKFAQAQHGKPYQWAGPTGPGSSFDCSGFMGSIAATIQNTNPWQRYWATGSFAGGNTAQGFVPGLGPGFSIGLFNGGPYGGHTAGTLSAVGPHPTVNVESGGSPSMVKYGVGAVGADHGSFTHRYHLPIGADGAFVSGGAGGFDFLGAVKKWIADKTEGIFSAVRGHVDMPSPPPEWLGVPGASLKAGVEAFKDYVADTVSNLGHLVSGVWSRITTLFDTGGVWKSGTVGVNLSGADEYVFTNRAMRDFQLATESLAVAGKELTTAYNGGDWGYAELARILGREDWARAIIAGATRLGEINRAVNAGVDAANAVWAEQAPGQDDWIQAGWDFLGMGDSLTAGLIRKGAEFNALVADYEADMAEADVDGPDVPPVDDEVTVSEPVTVDAPAIEVPSVADTTSDDSGPVATAGGAGDSGLTVVINLDGVEAVRERIEKVEDGVVEIDKELDALKTERRALDVAANVLLS